MWCEVLVQKACFTFRAFYFITGAWNLFHSSPAKLKKKTTYFGMRRNRQQKGFSVFDCRLFSLACTSFCRFGRRCRKLIVSVSFCLLCKRKSTRILGHLYAGRRFVLPRILLLRKTLSRKLLVNNIIFSLQKKIV